MPKLLIMPLLLLSLFVQAQKGTTAFSVSYGQGKGQIKPIAAKVQLLGNSSEGSIKTFEVGAYRMIGKHVALEIGASILNHRYQYTLLDEPGRKPVYKSENTFVLPIKLRIAVLKYIFISGGFLLNEEFGENDGLGIDIGFGIGAGVQYYFKNKYGVFIYPQTNIHSLTIGLSEQHVAFGLAYKIN